MSNDKPTAIDKSVAKLADDEAFIDDIYQQFDTESSDESELYPVDSQLDEAILAQARRAVASKPKAVKTTKQTWFVPLSTAASLVLVSLLVWQQKDIPITPELEISPTTQNEDNVEVLKEKSLEIERFSVSSENRNVIAESAASPAAKKATPTDIRMRVKAERQPNLAPKSPPRITEQSEQLAFSEANTQEPAALVNSSARGEVVDRALKVVMGLTNKKRVNIEQRFSDLPQLTAESRTNFVEQDMHWRLIEERASYYVIELIEPHKDSNNNFANGLMLVDKKMFFMDKEKVVNHSETVHSFMLIKQTQEGN